MNTHTTEVAATLPLDRELKALRLLFAGAGIRVAATLPLDRELKVPGPPPLYAGVWVAATLPLDRELKAGAIGAIVGLGAGCSDTPVR